LDGVAHSVEVQAATLFEAAATALSIFRQHGWVDGALTPQAILRVEVQPPTTVHEVPLKAVEQWMRSPSSSPKEFAAKRRGAAGEG
jgi:hypothetical protein